MPPIKAAKAAENTICLTVGCLKRAQSSDLRSLVLLSSILAINSRKCMLLRPVKLAFQPVDLIQSFLQ